MNKLILKQILKEFWIPATIALLWTIANIIPDEIEINAINFIKEFGPAFFFVSWLLAQYWRVKKQLTVEKNFITVEDKLKALTENLEQKTNDLVNHITGGDSYYYYKIGQQLGPDWFSIECYFKGDYTLIDNEIVFFSKNSNHREQKMTLSSLNKTLANEANQQLQIKYSGGMIEPSSFIFSSSGKKWVQMLDMELVSNKLVIDSKIYIFNTKEEIKEKYEVDYIESSKFVNQN